MFVTDRADNAGLSYTVIRTVSVKVVSERLGHATAAFTIDTYQHVLPGMQANAARLFEGLILPGFHRPDDWRKKTRRKRR